MTRIFPQSTTRVDSNDPSASRLTSSMVQLLHGHSAERAYSVTKFLEYRKYCESVSAARMIWVCVTTPIPALMAATMPTLLPLQNPLLGVDANGVFFVHMFLLIFIISFGAAIHTRAGAQVPSNVYSGVESVLVAICAGVFHISMMYPLCRFWTFPVPLMWVVGSPVYSINLCLAHVIVLRHKLPRFLASFKQYLVPFLIQASQLVLYPAFSVLFEHVGGLLQVLLTLIFPGLKLFIRFTLSRFTRGLDDFGEEVAVSGVEICASLYQAMIMQGQPSLVATAFVMGVDLIHGLVSIKFFMDKNSCVPQHDLVGHAQRILVKYQVTTSERTETTTNEIRPCTSSRHQAMKDDERLIVQQALELVSSAESILLVEYFEVVVPVINSLFIVIASQFSSARYNDHVAEFYNHPSVLARAVQSVLFYSVLQAVSLVVMHLVMRSRYGMSAIAHLAFILEHHQLSIQGKLVAWMTTILHFTVIHYGTDFLFEFDFETKVHHLLGD